MADQPTSEFGTIPDTSSLEAFESTQPAQPVVPTEEADAAKFAQELIDRPMPTPTPSAPPGYIHGVAPTMFGENPYRVTEKNPTGWQSILGWNPDNADQSFLRRFSNMVSPNTADE